MSESVHAALAAETVADTDQAIAALARAYADAIDDDPAQIKDLGPKLLAALEALQLSPRARSLARIHALTKVAPNDRTTGGRDDLAGIRARRRRKYDPAVVDASPARPVTP